MLFSSNLENGRISIDIASQLLDTEYDEAGSVARLAWACTLSSFLDEGGPVER